MFILTCKIEIGKYIFHSVNEVEITKSVTELVDMAVIKMPTKFKIRSNNEQKYIEEVIKPGDSVKITLGYEGKYEGVEFTGIVKKVNPKIPMEIHCEDAMWLLRRKNISKSWKKTTLKEVLQEIVSGTEIKLSKKIPDVALESWIIRSKNGTQALQEIKETMAMSVFLEDDGTLYCGLQQSTNIGQRVKYDLNYNLVENNLEFKTADEKKIKVIYSWTDKKTNKKKTYTAGDEGGEERKYNLTAVYDEKVLQSMADKVLKEAKYDGFEGDVTSFLIPFATRGMTAELIDKEHKNREGNYFIKQVVTTYGTSGARRKVTIGNRL
ncbi:late control protein [Chryseobacterium sp.]|uniref:late control protein n=1 Tax=Chryseobacterium sp. TaxID=1871047 RepID=UPI00289CB32B|nr:late control protein [Chryseobacterium sp.]